MPERLLVVGNNGREHALGWKLHQSPGVQMFFAPGNAGTETIGTNVDIGTNEIDGLARFAHDHQIDLTVVGPEAPLAAGIVNVFQKDKLPIFGPTQEAAQIETNKIWALELLRKYRIPHADFQHFSLNQYKALCQFALNLPWEHGAVVKYPYLAAGKGVLVPDTQEELMEAVKRVLADQEFGPTNEVLLQERLIGKEVSLIALTDGNNVVPLLPATDYKRINDGDQGPNTGGMGAYAPSKNATTAQIAEAYNTILVPTVRALREEGVEFKGAIYAGLMITAEGPKIIEYNCRFGDPETQPLMALLKSDLKNALQACVNGTLTPQHVIFYDGAAVCVVVASEKYPGRVKTGVNIHGLNNPNSEVTVFHAGTKKVGEDVVTAGGRVLGPTVRGHDLVEAHKKVYGEIKVKNGYFPNSHYRTDIALET